MIKTAIMILNNKIIVWAVIPILLLIVWIFLSYRYIASKAGVTVLTYPANASNYTSWKTTELLRGEKIEGQFIGNDNHLGIVAVRFKTFSRISKDAVIFRIKERGVKDWYYEYAYLVNQFQDMQYFTFGMPIIDNSLGKTYQFEIESVRGKPKDAIALSMREPVFVTKYKYSKHEILTNRKILAKFIYMKTTESLADNNFIASLTVFLLPFLFYLSSIIVLFYVHSYLKNNGLKKILAYLPFYLILLGALITVVLADKIYPLMITIVVILWIAAINKYRFESKDTLFFGGACLLISPFFLLFSYLRGAVNIAVWAYILLVIATIQAFIELKFTKKRK